MSKPPKQLSGKLVIFLGFPLIVSATLGVLILSTQNMGGAANQRALLICGAIAAVTGIALLIAILHAPRLRHAATCERCGYRLTGLTSDRCPECGQVI